MPDTSQPRKARGTVGHPNSALNLRLVLAVFGLVSCAILGILLIRADRMILGILVGVLALVAAVDIVVIQRRRHLRKGHHSLFE